MHQWMGGKMSSALIVNVCFLRKAERIYEHIYERIYRLMIARMKSCAVTRWNRYNCTTAVINIEHSPFLLGDGALGEELGGRPSISVHDNGPLGSDDLTPCPFQPHSDRLPVFYQNLPHNRSPHSMHPAYQVHYLLRSKTLLYDVLVVPYGIVQS